MQTFNETDARIFEIFCPGNMGKLSKIKSGNRKFAYYTSADTAKKIIQNEEIWFRNATVMNDFSEISYGLSLVKKAYLVVMATFSATSRILCFPVSWTKSVRS